MLARAAQESAAPEPGGCPDPTDPLCPPVSSSSSSNNKTVIAAPPRLSLSSSNATENQTTTKNLIAQTSNMTDAFRSERCKSWATTGGNQYWNLTPGHTTVFKGVVDGEPQTNTITITDKTIRLGGIDTRVVNDTVRNSDTGKLIEVAYDYFAVCKDSNSVFYFGEYTTDYKERSSNHKGSWAHSVNGTAGVIMPGINLVGARYYQELAPPAAIDQGETLSVTAGPNRDCLKVQETTPLEPGIKEYKMYCPGVGLVDDNGAGLVKSN
jgi:hypothetical protein